MLMRLPTRITDQCFAKVIMDFMETPKWLLPPPRGYAANTKAGWGRALLRAARPEQLGALSVFALRPAVIQAYLDGMADFPSKQENALSALRQVDKWGVRNDRLPHSITFGCEAEGSDGGHIPWEEEHVELAEQKASPDLAKAVTLYAGTGQRGSDMVRMCWPDIETFEGRLGINVRQKKTGRVLWVPFTGSLVASMESWERQPGPILRRPNGLPWKRQALTDAWTAERQANPALSPLRMIGMDDEGKERPAVLHGLRGTAVVRLNRAGATTRQIADMVGMSEPIVAHYLRHSNQKRNASAGIVMLERERTARERDRVEAAGNRR